MTRAGFPGCVISTGIVVLDGSNVFIFATLNLKREYSVFRGCFHGVKPNTQGLKLGFGLSHRQFRNLAILRVRARNSSGGFHSFNLKSDGRRKERGLRSVVKQHPHKSPHTVAEIRRLRRT